LGNHLFERLGPGGWAGTQKNQRREGEETGHQGGVVVLA
jgi:hypothetical protein